MKSICCALMALYSATAFAGGGPLGIDHKLAYDNSGIYKRSIQKNLLTLMVVGDIGGALWEGDETRLGRTLWQSVDSTILASASAAVMKEVFTRSRPAQTSDPNQFFQGSGHYSFPSGEVAAMSGIVTPFVLEYGKDNPWAYALEILPLYDAVARMKVQGHWQTDVLASFAVGTASGWYAHSRDHSFTLELLPGGFAVGLKKRF
ncbi:MAG: phosphatase PAP2 family protein [Burkholderiales bacterium]|nr:phosphatase PAP2 family protein [Burkholderiales bacterium]